MKRILALLLIAVLALSLFAGCEASVDDPATASGSDLPSAAEDETLPPFEGTDDIEGGIKSRTSFSESGVVAGDPRLDAVVAVCGDYQLTNRLLQIYYQMQYLNFMNSYGVYAAYFGLDTTKPLSEQASLYEGMSWEQYFLLGALEDFHEHAAVATAAKAAGYAMPQETEDSIAALPQNLETWALENNFATGLEFLQATFGTAVTVDDYLDYVRLGNYASGYEQEIYNSLSYTDDDLRAYAEEHADSFAENGVELDDSVCLINVRHILLTPADADGDGISTDEEWAAALADAEAVLEEYRADPTEENFAALANLYSADPGSNQNGGLYEDVYPGQMVPTFNDWCFDPGRQYGDTDIVETSYGYHIMFFVGSTGEIYWKYYALNNGYLNDRMTELIEGIMSQYTFQLDPDTIVLGAVEESGQ